MMHPEHLDLWIHNLLGGPDSNAEAIFRIFLAILAGAATGIEREYRGREAGFRTNILVCAGSAMAMISANTPASSSSSAMARAASLTLVSV